MMLLYLDRWVVKSLLLLKLWSDGNWRATSIICEADRWVMYPQNFFFVNPCVLKTTLFKTSHIHFSRKKSHSIYQPLRMCLFQCIMWDKVGWDGVIPYFNLFGAASSIKVKEYSIQKRDDVVLDIFTDELVFSLLSHHFSLPTLSSPRKCIMWERCAEKERRRVLCEGNGPRSKKRQGRQRLARS
jgi:hypothetical protein